MEEDIPEDDGYEDEFEPEPVKEKPKEPEKPKTLGSKPQFGSKPNLFAKKPNVAFGSKPPADNKPSFLTDEADQKPEEEDPTERLNRIMRERQ